MKFVAALLVFVPLFAPACAFDGPSVEEGVTESEPAAVESETAVPDAAPDSLQIAIRQAEQQNAGPLYHLRPQPEGWTASNHDNRFHIGFSQSGQVSINEEPGDEDPVATFTLAGVGRDANVSSRSLVSVSHEGNRIDYERSDGLTEWYLNGPHGLEQGFTLQRRPSGQGRLRLEIAVGGELTPRVQDGDIALVQDGLSKLAYHGLFVTDARGTELPAALAVVGQNIAIHVDDSDAVYPVTIDPWLEEARLELTEHLPAEGRFGASVAAWDRWAFAGMPGDDQGGIGSGAVYVFEGRQVSQKLRASDGDAGDGFGASVSSRRTHSRVVVGAPGASDRGAVYVFDYSWPGGWAEAAKLTASDGAVGDEFGKSVTVWGDTIVVGAPSEDDGGGDIGSAYVFALSAGGWTQQAKLRPTTASLSFGHSVSLHVDTVLVGAPGSRGAFLFERRTGTTWTEAESLAPVGGATEDEFGFSVSLDFAQALVGAPGDLFGSGAAYIFTPGGGWSQQAKLVAAGARGRDRLGHSVHIAFTFASREIVVGAPNYSGGARRGGGVFTFSSADGSTWIQDSIRTAPGAAGDDNLGTSVSSYDGGPLAGADGVDGPRPNVGAVYHINSSSSLRVWNIVNQAFAF